MRPIHSDIHRALRYRLVIGDRERWQVCEGTSGGKHLVEGCSGRRGGTARGLVRETLVGDLGLLWLVMLSVHVRGHVTHSDGTWPLQRLLLLVLLVLGMVGLNLEGREARMLQGLVVFGRKTLLQQRSYSYSCTLLKGTQQRKPPM